MWYTIRLQFISITIIMSLINAYIIYLICFILLLIQKNNTSEYDSNKEYIDEEALNRFINDTDDDNDHHVHHNHRHHQQDRHHRRDIHKVSE